MSRMRVVAVLLCCGLACSPTAARAQSAAGRNLEGMWSDPPTTILGRFCAFWCTDEGVTFLNSLVDNPANDARPFADLAAEADRHQKARYLRPRLTENALKTYPLDPADDPGFLRCEPWGLSRQMVAPHQLEIRGRGKDRLDLRYGEWDARRTVYLDGRAPAPGQKPTRLGHSIGRWEGDALIIETSGIARHLGQEFEYSDQLRVTERYTRTQDGMMLQLTATLVDPVTLREPLVLKKIWRWSPSSEIAPYTSCERPTEFRKGVAR